MGQYFKNKEIQITNFLKGLVSDGRLYPEDSVQGGFNFDFFPTHPAARRNPYILKYTPSLPAGSTILETYNKRFIDKDGNVQEVIILMVKDSGNRLHIYTDYYYNPSSDYDNYYNAGGTGFRSGLTEFTEYYEANFETGTWTIGGVTYNLRTSNANHVLVQAKNVYKGFYVHNKDVEVIGFVQESLYDTGYHYFKIVIDNTQVAGTDSGICRFPVNFWNRSQLASFSDTITFAELPNAVIISLGHNTRPLWLGMIKDRKYFRTVATSITYNTGHVDWISEITGKENYIGEPCTMSFKVSGDAAAWQIHYSRNGGSNWTLLYTGTGATFGVRRRIDGIEYYFSGNSEEIVADDTVDVAISVTYLNNWDGFWMGYLVPDPKSKKYFTIINATSGSSTAITKPTIGYELGISFELTRSVAAVSTLEKPDRIYQYCIELDGFQSVFVASTLCNEKYYVGNTDLIFAPYFDRRITGYHLFGLAGSDINTNVLGSSPLPDTKRLSDGFWSLRQINGTNTDDQIHVVMYYDFETHTNTKTHSEDMASDLGLWKFLNQYYWKNIIAKGKYIANVNNNIVLLNLSTDTINADLDEGQKKDIAGQYSIVVSQLQKGQLNATGILCSERIREAVKESPTGIVPVTGNEFLVFSKNQLRWLELIDTTNQLRWLELIDTTGQNFTSTDLRTIGYYEDKGAIGPKTIVRASTVDWGKEGTASAEFGAKEFSGIFFANYDSIYGFFRNEPIDLLQDRLREEYKTLTTAVKDTIVGGYYPSRREIFFVINGYIWIFSLENKNWRKYYYPHAPAGFLYNIENEMYFLSGNVLYQTASDNYLAQNPSVITDPGGNGITFKLRKSIIFGGRTLNKIFDKIDLAFDLGGTATYETALFKVTVFRNGSNTALLQKDYAHAAGITKKTFAARTRKRANTIEIEIENRLSPDTIKKFEIHEIKINTKLAERTRLKF